MKHPFVPLFVLLSLALLPPARAATKTWDGSSSGNWNNSQNWTPSGVPAAGDDLVFPTGVAQLLTTNGIPSLPAFNRITILGANYVIRGASLKLTNGLFCGNISAANAIDADIELRGPQLIVVSNQNASLLLRGASLSLGASGVTLTGFGRIDISNAITGSSGILKSGANTVLFHGSSANTYSGATTVNAGILLLSKTNVNAIPGPLTVGDGSGGSDADIVRLLRGNQITDAAAVTVNSSGWLDLSPLAPGQNETIGALTLNNGAHVSGPNGSTLTTAAPLTCTGNSMSEVDGGGYFAVAGTMPAIDVTGSGSGVNLNISIPFQVNGFTKTGSGWLRLHASLIGVGNIAINAGIFQPFYASSLGFAAANTVTVASGATFWLSGYEFHGRSLVLNGSGFGGTEGALRATGAGSNIVWGGAVTLASDSVLRVNEGGLFSSDTTLTLTNVVNGPGRLILDGGGTLRLTGNNGNTYSGGTLIRDGYLDLMKASGVTAIPGNVVIGDGQAGTSPDLHLSAANQIANGFDVTMNGGIFDPNTYAETIGTLNGGGAVTLGPGSVLTVSPGSGVTCAFNGSFSSPGSIVKAGSGTLILGGTSTHTGNTSLNAGTLQVDGSMLKSLLMVNGSARLQGRGVVGNVAPDSGSCFVTPGTSPGLLTCSNFNTLGPGSGNLLMEMYGTSPGAGYDQLSVRGGVNLTGLNLVPVLGFPSGLSNQFVLIDNDGADAVVGTFNGWPQNSILTINSEQFRISYTGGTGNDVVLTQVSGAFHPLLTIERIGPASVRLLWPTNNAAGFFLTSNTNLAINSWPAVSPPRVLVGTNYVVTNSVNTTRKFYRLELL